jgi:sec-independent protein translocase protein TatA
MGGLSIAHWAIVAVAASLLFGRNRFSSAMTDLGQGLKSFRRGLAEEPDDARSDG